MACSGFKQSSAIPPGDKRLNPFHHISAVSSVDRWAMEGQHVLVYLREQDSALVAMPVAS